MPSHIIWPEPNSSESRLKREGYLIIRPNRRSNETQYRLVPDLMADYLACRACYGDDRRVRDLPNRLWRKMGSDSLLPVLLRNFSEAEYIARLTHSHADKSLPSICKHDFPAAIALGILSVSTYAVLRWFQIGAITQRYID
jgi:hypothetical protein